MTIGKLNLLVPALLAALFVSACDTGIDGKEAVDQEQLRKKARLQELSEKVVGLYEGEIRHVDGEVYPIEIRIYSILEKVGVDDDGQAQTLPVNYGQIRLTEFSYPQDLDTYSVVLTADGQFEMVFDRRTVQGEWSDGMINNAVFTNQNGQVGVLSAKRVSREVPLVDAKDLRERRMRQYRPVQSVHIGKLYDLEGKFWDDFKMEFFMAEVPIPGGGYTVALLVNFKTINSTVLQAYPPAVVDWDPRTKIFRFQAAKGSGTVRVSGAIDKDNFIEIDTFMVTTRPFTFRKDN